MCQVGTAATTQERLRKGSMGLSQVCFPRCSHMARPGCHGACSLFGLAWSLRIGLGLCHCNTFVTSVYMCVHVNCHMAYEWEVHAERAPHVGFLCGLPWAIHVRTPCVFPCELRIWAPTGTCPHVSCHMGASRVGR